MADTTSLLHSAEALLALLDAPAAEQQSALAAINGYLGGLSAEARIQWALAYLPGAMPCRPALVFRRQ